jgi:probable F420-dependent oxidoreductase
VPEHTHIPLSRKTPSPAGGTLLRAYHDIYDPFIALNTAAAVTTTLKIGTGVCLIPQRDPIVTAKMVSTLDRVSNGRFLFGVGNGWNQDEIENHGTDFKTRHKLGRERIEAMKTIWAEDEPEYHGELVNFDKMHQWPKPVQKPHPPIIVGGAFPYAARRAIAYGNGWIPRADRLEKDGVGVVIDQFRDLARASGRDPATLPITIFRVPEDLNQIRFCDEIGVDRIVFSLPAAGRDVCMPIIDRWTAIKAQLGG